MTGRQTNEPITVEIRVTGRVQGVGFRANARRRAAALGLTGTAENLDDGSVRIRMTGPRPAIDQMIAWCHEGPPAARVDGVAVREIPTPAGS